MTIISNLSRPLSQVRVRTYRSFQAAESVWQRFQDTGTCYVFQTFELLSLWHTFMGQPAGVEPYLVEIEDPRAGPLLFLPLGLEKRRGVKRLVWLGDGIADYRGPIIGSGYDQFSRNTSFTELWQHVREHLPPCDVIHFEKQGDLIGDLPNPVLEIGGTPHPRSAHAVRLSTDWEDLYKEKCSSRTRKTDRAKQKGLDKIGPNDFFLMVEPQRMRDVLDRLADLKSGHLVAQGLRDVFATPGFHDFWQALIASETKDMKVYLSVLTVNGDAGAIHLGLLHRHRFYSLMSSYDAALGQVSPGALVFRRLLEWACGNDIEVFDFTIGDEAYKDRWCDTTMPLWDYLEPLSVPGRVYVAQTVVARKIKDIARNNTTAVRFYRDVSKKAHRLQDLIRFR